ncbi:PIN domain-containing protein [Azospirillum sp. ST 5-10]|uniref:PIN domain-containing protein n=1 Tax=unclassified Azospirillum TaxID=2630922 RepID=UPI003F4A6AE7
MSLAGLDTNVLLYAADNRGDADKHRTAVALLDRLSAAGRGLVVLQALTEFYAVATRTKGIPPDQASRYVEVWSDAFPVREAVLADVADAMRVHRAHGIPFWDGMMWAVARRAGARYLLSEDLQDGRDLEGVRFVNPFRPENRLLLDDALNP